MGDKVPAGKSCQVPISSKPTQTFCPITKPTKNEETEKKVECYLTEEQLKKIMPYATDINIKKYLTPINYTLKKYEINTPLRVAHFLAQLAHESGSLNYVREIANGTAYEGRKDLGNTEPGDGPRFKGRGLIQLTGRANYKKYGDSINADLVSNPENLENPDLATDVAGWFWNERKLNPLADQDDIEGITRKINGGTNGLKDREEYLKKAKNAKLCEEKNSTNGITVTRFNAGELCKSGCSYYQKRHDDYVFRHSCCESKSSPPDYYLDYGLKYCEKFTRETYPKLSPEGQQWLKKARCNLQIMMEKGLQNKPELESSSEKFRKFAFNTHPKAYLDAGLADLSPKDWFYISTTPELKEWLKLETWQ
ncbi:MAG: glycoside hydrolase family 19 protein [Thioploca sp.]|nr:glycoside hydrolase family 19 protein [Thioploca sp.]